MSGIPYASVPGMSSSRQKLGGELVTASDKKNHRCNFSITVEKKKVDGQPKICYRLDNYNYDYMKGEPLKEEYTDGTKFANDVKDMILGIGDQL